MSEALLDPTQRRKQAMRDLGLTGSDVANACGYSEGMVSQVLHGDRLAYPASRRIMSYIADRLGRAVADLWPELPAEPPDAPTETAITTNTNPSQEEAR